jgi:small subunit ribosomal protein S6
MRDYELVVLLHPDLEINLDKPLKKVKDVITSNGGKVINQDVWGKRKLAYAIRKENFAVYVYFEIQLPPEAVSKVEGTLNITNEVIRYLVTNPVPKSEDDESEDEEEKTDEKEDKEEKPKKTKSSKAKDEEESKEKEG